MRGCESPQRIDGKGVCGHSPGKLRAPSAINTSSSKSHWLPVALLDDDPGGHWEAVLAQTGVSGSKILKHCWHWCHLPCLLSTPPHPQVSRLFPSGPSGHLQTETKADWGWGVGGWGVVSQQLQSVGLWGCPFKLVNIPKTPNCQSLPNS